jgi:serine protease Do
LIGVRLEPISSKQFRQNQPQYRGGLLVTDVRPDSPAERQGVMRGDILVGMHIWETVTLDNVAYILNRPDLSSLDPIKFYILRKNDTFWGHLSVSAQK